MEASEIIGQWTVIRACPGAGKSTFVVQAALEAAQHYGPESVAVITYTIRAASNLIERLNTQRPGMTWGYIGTLHGLALRIVNEDREVRGLSQMSILTGEAEAVQIREIATRYNISQKALREALTAPATQTTRKASQAAWDVKQRRIDDGVCSYDELIRQATAVIKRHEVRIAVKDGVRPVIDALLIDEIQDANADDIALYHAMPAHTKLAVGDPHQSIFQFRGGLDDATAEIKVGGWKAAVISDSWRCPQIVADIGAEIAGKRLFCCRRESVGTAFNVVDKTPELHMQVASLLLGTVRTNPHWTAALICRTNAEADSWVTMLGPLVEPEVTVKRHGTRTADESIGMTSTLLAAVLAPGSRANVEAAVTVLRGAANMSQSVEDLAKLINLPSGSSPTAVIEWISAQWPRFQSLPVCVLIEGADSVREMVARLSGASGPPTGTPKTLDVMTVHGAKGGEWSLVIAPAWADRIDRSVADRNLAYVTLTRTIEAFVPVYCEGQIPSGLPRELIPEWDGSQFTSRD